MGKGDKKSKRGKIAIGSYGVTRKRADNKVAVNKPATEAVASTEAAKPVRKKKTA